MATYIHGFDRMQQQHEQDYDVVGYAEDDLEECTAGRPVLAPASYPTSARRGGGLSSAARTTAAAASAKSSLHDMRMVELKHGSYDGSDHHQQQQHYASYDPSAQRWLYQDVTAHVEGGVGSHHHHHRTAATGQPRRHDLHHVPGERDHLLTSSSKSPVSPGRHARSAVASPLSSSSSSSAAAPIAFTMTASSSSSATTATTMTTTTTTTTTTTFSYASTASSPSAASLASSAPMVLVYPGSPSSSSLKKTKKHNNSSSHNKKHHHHHHHHQQQTAATAAAATAKKRVTWVDESVAGMRLEEVIEVERYLKQHGSVGWWLEMVWDNKPYFLLLFGIALLFLASITFILYKLLF